MTHSKLTNDTIDRIKHECLITNETAKTLKIPKNTQKTPKFHIPKIRKIANHGGLIVSYVGCNFANISKFVDYHLQPIVENTFFSENADFSVRSIPQKTFQLTEHKIIVH